MSQASSIYSEHRLAERFLVSLPVETDRGPATTCNVSVSGLYLLTKYQLDVGDRLNVVLTIPDRETATPLRVEATGNVVRVEHVEGGAGAGIALDEASAQLAQVS